MAPCAQVSRLQSELEALHKVEQGGGQVGAAWCRAAAAPFLLPVGVLSALLAAAGPQSLGSSRRRLPFNVQSSRLYVCMPLEQSSPLLPKQGGAELGAGGALEGKRGAKVGCWLARRQAGSSVEACNSPALRPVAAPCYTRPVPDLTPTHNGRNDGAAAYQY